MRGEEALAFPLEKHQKQHIPTDDRDQGAGGIHPYFVLECRSIHHQVRHIAMHVMKQPKCEDLHPRKRDHELEHPAGA